MKKKAAALVAVILTLILAVTLFAGCASLTSGSGSENSGNNWYIWVILGVLLVFMVLMSVIPNKKRQKKAQEMMNSIRVGSKIKTIGGFIGEIKAINNDRNEFVVDVSANGDGSILVTIDRAAVYTVLNPATPAPETVAAADDLAQDVKAEEKADEKADKKKKRGKKHKEEGQSVDLDSLPADDAAAERAKMEKKAKEQKDEIFELSESEAAPVEEKPENDKQDENPDM